MEALKSGTLPGGAVWELSESRKKAPRKEDGLPIKGRHLIIQFADGRLALDVETEEAGQMYTQALQLANDLAVESGRYRICQNGPLTCNRPHYHLHIILPEKNEELEPIVARPK